MESYSLSVCLTDLQGAQVQANQNGKQFVFIPIEDADLLVNENGKVYLNLNLWANKSGQPNQYGKTHNVKQNFSKEKREKMGDAKTPFIGSGKPIKKNQNNGYPQQQSVYQQQPPQGYAQPAYPQNPAPQNNPYGDNMPF